MLERPPIHAPRAAVATAHPLASEAALAILRLGGSAADAAVAAGAALTVVEPWASQIGGDAFAIYWDAASGRARAIQGSGIAPAGVDVRSILAGGSIPLRGGMPITVPGMVGAWFRLHKECGRLAIEDVLAPAIRLAGEGFPVSARWEMMARLLRPVIESDPGISALFFREGRVVREGDWVRQPDLAATLEELARKGPATLYGGPLGKRIAREIQARGGVMSIEDLAAHETEVIEPLSIEIDTGNAGPVRVLEQPPVSQGGMVLAILRVLEQAGRQGLVFTGEGPGPAAREIHLQVEAYRRIRAERDRWFGDPRFADPPLDARIEEWLSKEHAAKVFATIDPRRAGEVSLEPDAGEGAMGSSDAPRRKDARSKSPGRPEPRETTYACVVDTEGNAVSWIQSIYHRFGAGWMVPGTGILLNNRMNGFSLDPSSPNRLEAGKRPIHTLNTWMVLRDGKPWLIGGTPGAQAQIMVNVQILRARLARSVPLARALQAPRWEIDLKDRICLEGRFPREVRRRLERRGHSVLRVGPWNGPGFYQAIERLEGGGWSGCTDPRGEGLAIGF